MCQAFWAAIFGCQAFWAATLRNATVAHSGEVGVQRFLPGVLGGQIVSLAF